MVNIFLISVCGCILGIAVYLNWQAFNALEENEAENNKRFNDIITDIESLFENQKNLNDAFVQNKHALHKISDTVRVLTKSKTKRTSKTDIK